MADSEQHSSRDPLLAQITIAGIQRFVDVFAGTACTICFNCEQNNSIITLQRQGLEWRGLNGAGPINNGLIQLSSGRNATRMRGQLLTA